MFPILLFVGLEITSQSFQFSIAALAAAFGVIHSRQPGNPAFLPWNQDAELLPATPQYLSGYAAVAILPTLWGVWRSRQPASDGPN